jgi:hypothetical protein
MTIQEFVTEKTIRGDCKCGRCSDVSGAPDPTGPNTVDMTTMMIGLAENVQPDEKIKEEFLKLTRECKGEFQESDPLDGKAHNYQELGAWIGSQALAIQYMGLGVILGIFKNLSPRAVLGNTVPRDLLVEAALSGFLQIQMIVPKQPEVPASAA